LMIGIDDSPSGLKSLVEKLMEWILPTRLPDGSLAKLMLLIGFRY